jgi:hypothetical protein
MLTDFELETAVQELRSFVGHFDQRDLQRGSRTANYVDLARRALAAYENAARSPARDERLRALARETRKLY